MSKKPPALQGIFFASPCAARWSDMSGSDRVRFCGACKRNVYRLGGLYPTEAELLVAWTEGRSCSRLYQRDDGTITVGDCPVGQKFEARRVRAAAKLRWAALGAALAGLIGLAAYADVNTRPPSLEPTPIAPASMRQAPSCPPHRQGMFPSGSKSC
jgi:hypothetical protein